MGRTDLFDNLARDVVPGAESRQHGMVGQTDAVLRMEARTE